MNIFLSIIICTELPSYEGSIVIVIIIKQYGLPTKLWQ